MTTKENSISSFLAECYECIYRIPENVVTSYHPIDCEERDMEIEEFRDKVLEELTYYTEEIKKLEKSSLEKARSEECQRIVGILEEMYKNAP